MARRPRRIDGPARQSIRQPKAESVMKTLKVEAVYLMAYPSGAVSSTRRYARR